MKVLRCYLQTEITIVSSSKEVSHAFLLALVLSLVLSACASLPPPCSPSLTGEHIYVTEEGWHAQIGIPVEELKGRLVFYRDIFPGAKTIMFGYGKKTFFTAPPDTWSEYVLGPFPGPAAIQVFALNVTTAEAYPGENTIALELPQGGALRLSNYIWNDLVKDASGKPQIIAPSTYPDGLFYAAQSEYNIVHTCNTWTADALASAGLPISGEGVTFSDQVMSQVSEASQSQCQP